MIQFPIAFFSFNSIVALALSLCLPVQLLLTTAGSRYHCVHTSFSNLVPNNSDSVSSVASFLYLQIAECILPNQWPGCMTWIHPTLFWKPPQYAPLPSPPCPFTPEGDPGKQPFCLTCKTCSAEMGAISVQRVDHPGLSQSSVSTAQVPGCLRRRGNRCRRG